MLKTGNYYRFLLLIIPVNIYAIGDFIGAGISFPFFKFQISFAGKMLFSISQELSYVLNGIYHHNTAISILVWIAASVFLISTVIVIFMNTVKRDIRLKHSGSTIDYFSGLVS